MNLLFTFLLIIPVSTWNHCNAQKFDNVAAHNTQDFLEWDSSFATIVDWQTLGRIRATLLSGYGHGQSYLIEKL